MKIIFYDCECLHSPEAEGYSWGRPWQLGLAVAATTEKGEGGRQWIASDAPDLVRYFGTADAVIGFNCLRFDLPLIEGEALKQESGAYYEPKEPLAHMLTHAGILVVDMLLDIYDSLGRRMKGTGLGPLSICTLGDAKVMEGALAPVAWADHRLLDVIGYCDDDVDKSRRLFNHGLKSGWLKRPGNPQYDKTDQPIQFDVTWNVRTADGEVIQPFRDWHQEAAAKEKEAADNG